MMAMKIVLSKSLVKHLKNSIYLHSFCFLLSSDASNKFKKDFGKTMMY